MSRKRILLVEDNEQIMQGNERMLTRRGYEVVTALTLAQARSALEARTPAKPATRACPICLCWTLCCPMEAGWILWRICGNIHGRRFCC